MGAPACVFVCVHVCTRAGTVYAHMYMHTHAGYSEEAMAAVMAEMGDAKIGLDDFKNFFGA